MIEMIFVLLILFQVKHYVADYPLQNVYMLGKFKETGWVLPLATHCSVHAVFTFLICSMFNVAVGVCILLALMDFAIHFTMDRIKASPKMLGRFKPDQKEFWWALGIDQMVHHLTHYLIIALILLVKVY